MARLGIAVLIVWLMTGCAFVRAPVRLPMGAIYTQTRAPLQVDFDETRLGSKRSEASTSYFLWPLILPMNFAWGDAGVAEAAREGNITTVHHVDYEFLNVLGMWARFTTIVYGD